MNLINTRRQTAPRPLLLTTLYGKEYIDEPVLIDLIQSPSMQRLKKINQYGIAAYVSNLNSFTRYEHSIGVLVLLKKFKRPLLEQIAGLLHDVSHTVFSHIADIVFDHSSQKNSYQDDIHEWFINQTELTSILKNHGIAVQEILHKKNSFKALEQDLPQLCADRLEYNLLGAFVAQQLTKKELLTIIEALRFKDETWFFIDSAQAKKFAEVSLYLQQHVYTSPKNCLTHYWAAKALKRALAINLISMQEIHFSTDKKILKKLKQHNDLELHTIMLKVCKPTDNDGIEVPKNLHIPVKFRGVNPLVNVNNCLRLLTDIDDNFATAFDNVKKIMLNGWYFYTKC